MYFCAKRVLFALQHPLCFDRIPIASEMKGVRPEVSQFENEYEMVIITRKERLCRIFASAMVEANATNGSPEGQ